MPIFILLALSVAFLASAWGIHALPDLAPDIHHYYVYVYWLGALSLGYALWLWRSWDDAPFASVLRRHWRLGAALSFALTVASPVLYETDPIRYYWDGLSVVRGESPYVIAPKDHPAFAGTPWAQTLNHPSLPTIYPPGAQGLFALSTLINPFFAGRLESSGAWQTVSLWQASLGWKLVMGLFAAAAVILWRKERWDLLLFHPLFLTRFALNVHIDGVMMVLLMAATLALKRAGSSWWPGVLLGLSVACKWITALLLPFFALRLLKSDDPQATAGLRWRPAVLCVLGTLLVVGGTVAIGQWGAEGKFFYSFKKFANEWLFFGFWQRWALDGLRAAGLGFDAALPASKFIGYSGFAVLYVTILLAYGRTVWPPLDGWLPSWWRLRGGVTTAMALALLAFYSALPVINPWYLLVLVPLSLQLRHRLLAPLVMTFAVSASALYYIHSEDPIVARYGAYLAVVAAMVYDDVRRIRFLRRNGLVSGPFQW